jgi:hypothetical protein
MASAHNAFPPGVTDEHRAFDSPYRTLLPEDASQLCHSVREVVTSAHTHLECSGASCPMANCTGSTLLLCAGDGAFPFTRTALTRKIGLR